MGAGGPAEVTVTPVTRWAGRRGGSAVPRPGDAPGQGRFQRRRAHGASIRRSAIGPHPCVGRRAQVGATALRVLPCLSSQRTRTAFRVLAVSGDQPLGPCEGADTREFPSPVRNSVLAPPLHGQTGSDRPVGPGRPALKPVGDSKCPRLARPGGGAEGSVTDVATGNTGCNMGCNRSCHRLQHGLQPGGAEGSQGEGNRRGPGDVRRWRIKPLPGQRVGDGGAGGTA